jgi:hypothetical protein
VAEAPVEETTYDVTCPHCGKTFQAELIAGTAPRYEGFKCRHCRLFVSYERADEQDLLETDA